MALTKMQVNASIELFVRAFITASSDEERRAVFIKFEDNFADEIEDWKKICREKISKVEPETEIVEVFDLLCSRKETNSKLECKCRALTEADFTEVRFILNQAFELGLSELYDYKLRNFINAGLSFVAYTDKKIVGVTLAYKVPDVDIDTVYLDSFAVLAGYRGKGIGSQMFAHLREALRGESLCKIKLQTKKELDAYNIYTHWGFRESGLVQLSRYLF